MLPSSEYCVHSANTLRANFPFLEKVSNNSIHFAMLTVYIFFDNSTVIGSAACILAMKRAHDILTQTWLPNIHKVQGIMRKVAENCQFKSRSIVNGLQVKIQCNIFDMIHFRTHNWLCLFLDQLRKIKSILRSVLNPFEVIFYFLSVKIVLNINYFG